MSCCRICHNFLVRKCFLHYITCPKIIPPKLPNFLGVNVLLSRVIACCYYSLLICSCMVIGQHISMTTAIAIANTTEYSLITLPCSWRSKTKVIIIDCFVIHKHIKGAAAVFTLNIITNAFK